MENHNSLEAMAKRAAQEDPIVMYLVVREDLNMSIGKTAAQCAHTSQMLQIKYQTIHNFLTNCRALSFFDLLRSSDDNDKIRQETIFEQWLNSSFRKVVLRADEKEWDKLKDEISEKERVIVVDAGLTEIPTGSETVMGIWPMHKSARPKILQKLQLLK